jgi:hypothetical protein
VTTEPDIIATLIIGTSSSICGNCGKPTLTSADRHTDISGPDRRPGQGCGARFVDMRARGGGVTDDELRRTRPDLPIYGRDI